MSSIVTRKMDFQFDPEIQETFTLPTLHDMDLSDLCSTASSPMSMSDYSPVTSPESSTASPPISPTKQCLSPSSLSDSSSCGSIFENSSTKKSTKSTKRQGSSTQRRNERERRRVKMVSEGFANLRKHVPLVPAKGKKLSKVETLRTAIEYIRQLQEILQENDRQGERNHKCLQGASFVQNSLHFQTLTQQNPYTLPRTWNNGAFTTIPGEITIFPSNEVLYPFQPNDFACLDMCF